MNASQRPAPVDMRVLADMLDNDPDEMGTMLAEFRINARTTAAELRSACRDGQPSEAAALAHRLKSSSRWVGALALGDICASMELAGRAGRRDQLDALMVSFESELVMVEHFLAAR